MRWYSAAVACRSSLPFHLQVNDGSLRSRIRKENEGRWLNFGVVGD